MPGSVFLSSSVLSGTTVSAAIKEFVANGITHVEWSGGHQAEKDAIEQTILTAFDSLTSRLHNYFPPPNADFVLNLASPDREIASLSVEHVEKALQISASVGASKYGVHAGFFFDPDPAQLGRPFSNVALNARREVLDRFLERYLRLQERAAGLGVQLYVENNVLSHANAQAFDGKKVLMLLDAEDWHELYRAGVENLLLDLAHLKVSCSSLGLDYTEQAQELFGVSDYIHVSETDGTADTNDPVLDWDGVLGPLKEIPSDEKDVTVEVYTSLNDAIATQKLLQGAF